jgi:hypothetical protein
LLRYPTFPEGTPHHAEPGDIFKRTGGINMENENQELADSLEFVEVLRKDKDGNIQEIKVY